MKTSQNTLRIFSSGCREVECADVKGKNMLLMLIQKSYEFTCLIIAIFGKDCQAFLPYLAIIFLFFSATKNSGTQCPEKEMTAFHAVSNLF